MQYKPYSTNNQEYRVFADGSVYSLSKGKYLKQTPNNKDSSYVYMTVYVGSRQYVHRLVCTLFNGPQPSPHIALGRYEVNHIDMNKSNNHYTNLEWITHSENMRKARSGKTWQAGRNKGYKATLTARERMSEAKKIKVLLFNDTEQIIKGSIQDAADYLKVHRRTIERKVNTFTTLKGFKLRTLTK